MQVVKQSMPSKNQLAKSKFPSRVKSYILSVKLAAFVYSIIDRIVSLTSSTIGILLPLIYFALFN